MTPATQVLRYLLNRFISLSSSDLVVEKDTVVFDIGAELPELAPNLLLIVKPGSLRAKYSKREDGSNTITIFYQKPYKTTKDLISDLRELLVARKGSFIHEFNHYLDMRGLDDVIMPASEQEEFTSVFEIKAYVAQALFELEEDIDLCPKNLLKKRFGNSFEEFARIALRYFHPLLLKYASAVLKEQIIRDLKGIYKTMTLEQMIKETVREVVLKEKAPPGMEDTIMSLKKKYGEDNPKVFAIAWSIYNKKHLKEYKSSGMNQDTTDLSQKLSKLASIKDPLLIKIMGNILSVLETNQKMLEQQQEDKLGSALVTAIKRAREE